MIDVRNEYDAIKAMYDDGENGNWWEDTVTDRCEEVANREIYEAIDSIYAKFDLTDEDLRKMPAEDLALRVSAFRGRQLTDHQLKKLKEQRQQYLKDRNSFAPEQVAVVL